MLERNNAQSLSLDQQVNLGALLIIPKNSISVLAQNNVEIITNQQ